MMKKYILPIATVALAFALTSCHDDDETIWVVDDPTIGIAENDASYTYLSFEWDAVAGVNQYGYELADPDGTIVARGVTDDNTITFTDLAPSTTYTLTVYVYGPDGTTTRRIVMTGTTMTLVKLAAPEITAEQQGARIYVAWDQNDNADYYHYSYLVNGEEISGDITEYGLELRGIPEGDYTITVTAITEQEGYLSSDPANCNFSRVRNSLWSAKGTYVSCLLSRNNTWEATLTSYDDGSYVISDFYGVPGYDLEFTVNDDTTLDIETDRMDSWGYYLVASGNSKVTDVNIWPSDGYSAFDGNEEYGMIWFYATDGGYTTGYDTFEWGNDEEEEPVEPEVPAVDLSGTYNVTSWYGYESYWFTTSGNWETFSYSGYDATITQTGDKVTLTGFLGYEEYIEGTIDVNAKTITFPAQDIYIDGYAYRFACERDDLWTYWNYTVVNDPLVATYDDDFNIDLSGYGVYSIYSDGSLWVYFTGITHTLAKK